MPLDIVERLKALVALEKDATAGPWMMLHDDGEYQFFPGEGGEGLGEFSDGSSGVHDDKPGNGPLILALRNSIEDIQHAADEIVRLRKENDTLRGVVAAAKIPCVYCGLENMSECKLGFPGCNRADDLMIGQDQALQRTGDTP